MKVDVSTRLSCSAAKAWDEVQKSSLLLRVMWPLVRLLPVGTIFPERWSEGLTVLCRPLIFGFIPIGVRSLHFEKIDPASHKIETREHDALVRRWDHVISVSPLAEGQSIYRDEIEIDAGRLSVVVWTWASCFYRHRQRRWRKIARTL